MKKMALLSLLILSQVLGDICLSEGMKSFGAINAFNLALIPQLLIYLLTNHWIWLGVILLVSSLGFYLIAISRFDLSYVLPIHAFSYVLNAVFAGLLLGEEITISRWISTAIITTGVFIVGFNEVKISRQKTEKLVPFWLFPVGIYLTKTWLGVILISLADSGGDLSLAIGMKTIGKFQLSPKLASLKVIPQIITNPFILLGIICQTMAFIGFISVLSWADVSFVRPATALTYVFSLIGSKYILKETISQSRLLGIVLIGFGIVFHR